MTESQMGELWDKHINAKITEYKNRYEAIYCIPCAKELIYNSYENFRHKFKEIYMEESDALLDRHKVCASIICAILITNPIKYLHEKYFIDNFPWLLNESLAIYTGFEVLRAYIKTALEKDNYPEQEVKIKTDNNQINDHKCAYLKRFEGGIKVPNTNHGDYLHNFKMELYYTSKEGTYNLLALANELFLIEHLMMETDYYEA